MLDRHPLGEASPAAISVQVACYAAAAGDHTAGAEDQAAACQPSPGDRVVAASPRERAEEPDPASQLASCLERVFAAATADVGPEPLRLHLGALGEGGPVLAFGPVAVAAGLVALLALGGTLLLGRRVLRPISAMTVAARRVGAGDLTLRVTAPGHDELAELARSFNAMADSLQQAEDRQRPLVADVAHELRTPLANLRGYLEALKDGVVAPDQQLFTDLYREASLQQRIVDDLQDLALAEAGALTYHRTPIDVAELLRTCATAHQAAADAAGIALQVDVPTAPAAPAASAAPVDGPLTVLADPDRMRQALGNLVSNSLRATEPGGTITLAAAPADDRWITLTLLATDDGVAGRESRS